MLGTEEMIETVVDNLIDNAVSFSPGGEILVHLTRDGSFAHLVRTTAPGYATSSSTASSTDIIQSAAPNGGGA